MRFPVTEHHVYISNDSLLSEQWYLRVVAQNVGLASSATGQWSSGHFEEC